MLLDCTWSSVLSPLPPGQREGQAASPPAYSGAILGCSQQKMNLQVALSGAGELLAAAEHRGMGLELFFPLQIVLGVDSLSTKFIIRGGPKCLISAVSQLVLVLLLNHV